MSAKTGRSLEGLRESMFDALDKLRSGEIDPSAAKAQAEMGKVIIDAARLQLDFEKAWHEKVLGEKLRKIPLIGHEQ